MMSSVPETFAMDNHLAAVPAAEQEQLCYVHCNYCDTILAVGVPCSSLFKTVAVRCGHCANVLSVNLRGLLLPAANQLPFGQALLSPTSPHGLLDEMPPFPVPTLLCAEQQASPTGSSTITSSNNNSCGNSMSAMSSIAPPPPKPPQEPQLSKSAASSGNRTTEKRQRVPSAYNRFIKDEIQRIKANNPDISHREAFSAAAKNWAHFPHIQFGMMPDHGLKKTSVIQSQDGGECMLFRDGLYAAPAAAAASGMTVAPY